MPWQPSVRPVVLLIVAASLCWTVTGFAQAPTPQEEAARTDLVRQAQAAHAAGHHKEALDLATRASSIQLTPSLRYLLAHEQDELGLSAEAYANAMQCAREFERDAQLPDRDKFLPPCRALRDRLDRKIGRVIVNAPAAPDGLVVKVGGREVKSVFFGVAYPFTPGSQSVEATAPGHVPYRSEITVAPGATPVELTIPPLAVEVPPATAPCPPGFVRAGLNCVMDTARREGPNTSSVARSSTELQAVAEPGGGGRTVGAVLAIAGAAVALAGGVSWLVAGSKLDTAKEACMQMGCTEQQAYDSKKSVQSFDRLAMGAGIAGAGLLAVGATIFFAGRW